jgi:hypothetical protein
VHYRGGLCWVEQIKPLLLFTNLPEIAGFLLRYGEITILFLIDGVFMRFFIQLLKEVVVLESEQA